MKAGLARNKNLKLRIVNPSASTFKEKHFCNVQDDQIVVFDESFEEWVGYIQDEYLDKAKNFDCKLEQEKKRVTDAYVDAYKRTDDFKRTVGELCDSLTGETRPTSPHAYESITAIVPPKSDLSTLDLNRMASALPTMAERMMQSRPGLGNVDGSSFGERICSNCGHNYRRDAVMSPRCPRCGHIVM